MTIATLICPRCTGQGRITDPIALGGAMRALRLRAGLSLRQLAARIGRPRFTFSFISQLERGARCFSAEQVALVRRACSKNLNSKTP